MKENDSDKVKQVIFIWSAQRIPVLTTPNAIILTGFTGSVLVMLSFVLAASVNSAWLFLSVLGFAVSWLSSSFMEVYSFHNDDSRRWQRLVFSFISDSIGTLLVIVGFMIYVGSPSFLFGLFLLILYAWKAMISLFQYKVRGKCFADNEFFSSNKFRVLFSLMIITEFLVPWSIVYSAIFICALLLVTSIINLKELFKAVN